MSADAARNENDRGQTALVERCGVIEPGAKHGGWAAIVLRGAEDRDRVGTGRFIVRSLNGDRHHDGRPCKRGQDNEKEDPAESTPSSPERHATRYSGPGEQLLKQGQRPGIVRLTQP